MGRSENFKQYAADCMRQAASEQRQEDKTILLNVALAWVRLAQQSLMADAANATDASTLPPPEARGKAAAPPAQTVNAP